MRIGRSRVARLVQQLKSENAEERHAAAQALADLKPSVAEARAALEAACDQYPDIGLPHYESGQELLLRCAWGRPHYSMVPILRRDFARYTPKGRAYACRILADIDTDESWTTLRDMLVQYATLGVADTPSVKVSTESQARCLFPQVLEVLGQSEAREFRYEIAKWLLDGFQKGWFERGEFDAYAPHLVRAYQDAFRWLADHQDPESLRTLWDDEEHLRWRWAGEVMLDLMGYFTSDAVLALLHEATQAYQDPRLLLYAICSLIRQGQSVEPALMQRVADSDETRYWLYRNLSLLERLDLFPDTYREQRWIAQSDMVEWLTFPTEMGRPPDEIEWMGAYPIDTTAGEAEVHLFRFRLEDEPWQAGIAGPYLKAEIPTYYSLGATFSRFDEWDEQPPGEHVEAILSTVGFAERVETPHGVKFVWESLFDED